MFDYKGFRVSLLTPSFPAIRTSIGMEASDVIGGDGVCRYGV